MGEHHTWIGYQTEDRNFCVKTIANIAKCDIIALSYSKTPHFANLYESRSNHMSMAKTNRKIPILVATVLLAILAFVLILNTVIIPQEKYKRAMNLLAAGYYDEGYVLLAELGDTDAITKNKYDRAAALIKAESYDEAYAMLAELGDTDAITENKYDARRR